MNSLLELNPSLIGDVRRILEDEVVIRDLASKLYYRLNYDDSGIEWGDLPESEKEFYCEGIEAVRSALLFHLSKSSDARPTTA
jgi:hypothetical protein